ncbi:unnamed protein product [Medioppia subpectinata]|uniref:C2H2-type domain-containing protein n=1 Tax=Medioppia subpectinata TaxID=1979941 RepID=A0A7R9L9C9_9ACAR|nr:unnamed protein product [Medioppia subpectinata]CAG2117047.1 unnamed protein product [Medioppia subpectinata]
MSEESGESYVEELGEESDDSYVEAKRHKTIKCEYNGCLRKHLSRHTSKRLFACDFIGCQMTVSTAEGLRRHRRRHRSEPMWKCSTDGCVEMFVTQHQRNKHQTAVHNRKPEPKRAYRCDWPGCEWTGAARDQHRLQHTGEKPYPCLWPECGKRFGRTEYLKYHMNIHNNVKPYVCHWPGCAYSYAHLANLHHHVKRFHTK